jgi:MinD-like ATPase involved in chromosome partitioning or flagellar assembly
MNYKRITLLAGHYGSGKTNIAVNIALQLKKERDRVAIADLDIVNPYFRTKDSEKELTEAGIRLIVSEYANTNLDIPALPQEMYALVDDKGLTGVVDVGGDDQGAVALGRISPAIAEENDYDMLLVINRYRPLTRDAASTVEVMREIEKAASLPFTGIVNDSNLGADTTAEDILSSLPYAEEVSKLTGLPVVMTCAEDKLAGELSGKVNNLFPLHLQKRPV